ncbi:MAG: hypothetical protein KC550_01175 [Nanoarchaeota archaeon]|nr:hypothetical protein [Nanoarchaeota archaeon]
MDNNNSKKNEEVINKVSLSDGLGNAYKSVQTWWSTNNSYWNKTWKKPKNYLVGGLVCLALSTGLDKLNEVTVGDSVYNGAITSFGRRGYVWDTFEGIWAYGGLNRSVNGYFSLDEQARNGENLEELSKQLTEFAKTGELVNIFVRGVGFSWPWRSSTGSHIYKVEKINK